MSGHRKQQSQEDIYTIRANITIPSDAEIQMLNIRERNEYDHAQGIIDAYHNCNDPQLIANIDSVYSTWERDLSLTDRKKPFRAELHEKAAHGSLSALFKLLDNTSNRSYANAMPAAYADHIDSKAKYAPELIGSHQVYYLIHWVGSPGTELEFAL